MRLHEPPCESNQTHRHQGIAPVAVLLALPMVVCTALLMIQWLALWTNRSDLERAAEAGAVEATLPKASWQSVGAMVQREVSGMRIGSQVDPPMIEINGRPAGTPLSPRSGDEIAVSVSIDATAVVPDWLQPFGFSLAHRKLSSRVVLQMP